MELAGNDGRFQNVEGKVEGSVVTLKSPVSAPVKVCYDWKDCPQATLHSTTGLPAVPFELSIAQ